MLFSLDDGQMPVELHCKTSDGNNHYTGEQGADVGIKVHDMKHGVDNTSGHTGKGIYFLAEDERNLVDEDIADYTS